jgi:hypothetical protein
VNKLRLAARKFYVGREIRRMENEKNARYKRLVEEAEPMQGLPGPGQFYPCVMTSGGTMSAKFAKFVKDLTKRQVALAANDVDMAGSTEARAHEAAFLSNQTYQRLSRMIVKHFKEFYQGGVLAY